MKKRIKRRRKLGHQPIRPKVTTAELKTSSPETFNVLMSVLFEGAAQLGLIGDMKDIYGANANEAMEGLCELIDKGFVRLEMVNSADGKTYFRFRLFNADTGGYNEMEFPGTHGTLDDLEDFLGVVL